MKAEKSLASVMMSRETAMLDNSPQAARRTKLQKREGDSGNFSANDQEFGYKRNTPTDNIANG